MDNATHTLCCLALARACGSRLGPWGTATAVIAGNLPDLDIIVQAFGGRPAYLCHHRGVTHGLLGLALQVFVVSALMTAWGRARDVDVHPGGLRLAAALGLGSHLLLDSLNTYGVRPWLPFDGTWYYGDVAFIVDPWLWLAFGAGAALGVPPTRWGRRRWWFWNGVVTGFLFFRAALFGNPWAVPMIWGVLMPMALIARERVIPPARRQVASLAAIGLAIVYLLGLGVSSRVAAGHALRHGRPLLAQDVESYSSSPAPAIPWRFRVVLATPTELLAVDVDLLRGQIEPGTPLPRGLDDPHLPAVTETPEHDAWRVFSRQPFARRQPSGPRNPKPALILDDARYGWPGRPGQPGRPAEPSRRGFSSFALPLPDAPGAAAPEPDGT